jgi:hypothetical protein
MCQILESEKKFHDREPVGRKLRNSHLITEKSALAHNYNLLCWVQLITMSEKVIMWFKRMRTTKQSSFLYDAKEQFNGEDDSARISVVQSEPDTLTSIR